MRLGRLRASGSRLLRALSPIHTKPLRLANACALLINAPIFLYVSKNVCRNSSASSTLMPSVLDKPNLVAPYILDNSTTFICDRSGVSSPLRSEERRVGKEWRCWGAGDPWKTTARRADGAVRRGAREAEEG